MATIGTNALTLADLAKRMDSNDKIARIIELLAQKNQILDDMRWVEGNLPTGHRTTVRTGLPQATWRRLNYGVQSAKSTTAQITDTCGMLETYAEIDKALADLNGNTAEFRLSEDQAFLEGMSQQMAGTLFYGNTDASPERFMGLAHRFSTRNAGTPSSANVIHGGGSGSNNTSIWLVVWGELTVHGIIPKGSKAGLQHRDLGEQTLQDADGGKYQGYRTHYKWDAGLTVRDWRHAVRIANIDVPALDTGAAADIIKLMIKATHRVPSLTVGMPVFYCNRDIRQWLDIQALNKSNVQLKLEMVEGKPKTDFLGIPIKTCDQILSTEATVPT
jgi:hypothetical protein